MMEYTGLVQPVLGLFAVGATGWFVFKRQFRRALVPLLFGLLVVPAIGVVPAGHRGVVYSLGGGVSLAERDEGLTFIFPWLQRLTSVSVRTQKVFSDEVFSQSKDLQEITVVASVNYRVDPGLAAELYQRVGLDYEATVVRPALFDEVKAAVGQILAEDFALNRAVLADRIEEGLQAQLLEYGLEVQFINIEDAIFDPDFILAVKEKVIADQEAAEQERLIAAEAAKKQQEIIRAQAQARRTEIEAEAQARANRLLAASLSPALIEWRFLTTWDGVLPTTLIEGDGRVSLLIGGRVIE